MNTLKDLTFNQMRLIAQLSDVKGLRELSRLNNIDPAAMSRLLKDTESKIGFQIVSRSNTGLTLTQAGYQLVKLAKDITKEFQKFEYLNALDSSFSKIPFYTFGSRGFITSLVAGLFAKNKIESIQFKIKFVDASPQDLLSACLNNTIQIAAHIENWTWPNSWITQEVSQLTWGLVSRANHPLKSKVLIKETQKYPFVGASYLNQDRIERSIDVFPLKWSQRKIGHESQTAQTTKAILLASDHIAYVPLITVEKEIQNKELKILQVQDMQAIQMKLYLSVNQDRVSQKALELFKKSFLELQLRDQKLAEKLLDKELQDFPDYSNEETNELSEISL